MFTPPVSGLRTTSADAFHDLVLLHTSIGVHSSTAARSYLVIYEYSQFIIIRTRIIAAQARRWAQTIHLRVPSPVYARQ